MAELGTMIASWYPNDATWHDATYHCVGPSNPRPGGTSNMGALVKSDVRFTCSWHRAQCTLHENPVSQETHSISGKHDDEIMWNPVFVFWLTLTHCFNDQPKPNPPTPLAAGGARQRRNYQQQGARSYYKQQGARSKKWGIQAVRQSGRRLRARSVLQ